jgi:serine/threonine protein kinase
VTADQHPYLIMELCDGSYADRMKTSPLTAVEARDVGVKIADALADAHQLGVLHRDVKPANILYSRFGEPALADFGLAVLAEARDSSVTLEVLTPAYAAPEMFRHSDPSPAVDVYALCATLYAIMRGKPPRWQDDRNPSLITLMDLFTERVPDLPNVPGNLLDLLRHGMENEPTQRPSAADLRDRLAALQLDAQAAAPISGAPVSGGPSPSIYMSRSWNPHPPSPDDTPTEPRRARRARWWLGGLGALVLLGLGGLGAFLAISLGGDDGPPNGTNPSPSAGAKATFNQASLPGCLIPLPAGGRCPSDVECFGPVTAGRDEVRAEPVDCAGRHTWEAWAVGDLSTTSEAVDRATVANDETVRQVCAPTIFTQVTSLMDARAWEFEVLPPAAAAFAGGDRTFRCLAGKGDDALTGPALFG